MRQTVAEAPPAQYVDPAEIPELREFLSDPELVGHSIDMLYHQGNWDGDNHLIARLRLAIARRHPYSETSLIAALWGMACVHERDDFALARRFYDEALAVDATTLGAADMQWDVAGSYRWHLLKLGKKKAAAKLVAYGEQLKAKWQPESNDWRKWDEYEGGAR